TVPGPHQPLQTTRPHTTRSQQTITKKTVAVLEVTAADPEREWRLHEISEATGQPNQRSLRVLVEQLVGKGLLSKRTVKPRYVLYRAAPAHTEEAPTN
ncbi:hypothetical protein ACFYN3_26810, partial [Streptomyces lavendulae]